MKTYQTILFDLDGTLSDPKFGITSSVQYALAKFGIVEDDLDRLEPFIGPPLAVSFAQVYGFDEEQTKQAIAYYRERFVERGMFENVLYAEIPALLARLKAQGKTLCVATSKPTVFAEQILQHFEIASFFDFVAGSNLDGTRVDKTEVIEAVLAAYPHLSKGDMVMIGDRKHDLIGARNTGLDSIGVLYGYGSLAELQAEQPTHLAETVEALGELLL
jgi:phosphoglycolate phosphatase